MKSRMIHFLLLILLLGATLPAIAEPLEAVELEPEELPPVQVQSTSIAPGSLTQPPPEVQAEELRHVPGGTNLIDETQYNTGRVSSLEDMLRGQPGIITGSRGAGVESKLSIRGSAVDRNFHLRGVRVLKDGIPMNTADGNADFQWLEPFAIRNVEVYRGGNGLEYGASTLGGAINFVSPTGYTADGLQVRAETGSYGYVKGQVSSGGVLGKLDYYAAASGSYQNGFQKHGRSNAHRYTANVGYRFNEDVETRFYGGYAYSKMQIPGSLTKSELFRNPRKAAPNSLDFDEQHNLRQIYLANKTIWRIDEDQSVDAGVYWMNHHLDHPLFWNAFFLNGLGVLDQKTNTWGGSVNYHNNRDLLGHRNRFTAGINPQVGYTHEQRFDNLSGRKRGMKNADGGQFATTIDIYAQDQWYVTEHLSAVISNQLSIAVRNYNDRFNRNPNGNQTRNQDYLGVNPKAGFIYDFNDHAQLFGNFSRSFEPPTMLEVIQLGGGAGDVLTKELKAQRASTIEFGTRGSSKRLAWDATFYRSWVRNELLSLNDSLGNSVGTVSGSPTIHQGVEASLSVVLKEGIFTHDSKRDNLTALSAVGPALQPKAQSGKDRLVLRQVYDWTSLHFQDDAVYGNNRLPGLPPHLYRGELIYEHPSGFYIQPNLEWSITGYPVDYQNSMAAEPWALLGVRTGFRSKKGWSAFVELRNLTNKHYASAVQVVADARGGQPRVFSPGQGFSVYGGIELRW